MAGAFQHHGIDGQGTDGSHANGVAIGLRTCHGFCANQAGSACLVFHHHGLPQRAVHGIGDDAGHDVR
ncbi:hypothetical protein D3C71_1533900 [compost metagenome]